jgi:hypothetical protein
MVLVLGTRELPECGAWPNFLKTLFIWHANRDDGWSEYNATTQIFNSNKKKITINCPPPPLLLLLLLFLLLLLPLLQSALQL